MTTQKILETGAAALVFAGVFLVGGRFYPMRAFMKSRRGLLSLSAGVSVAYVFVHLMPELGGARETFVKSTSLPHQFDGMIVFLLALLGFLAFYSLDHFTRVARAEAAQGEPTVDFDAKVLGFGAYVGLVSYLLVNSLENSPLSLATYAFAMAVHFLTFDHGFRETPGTGYCRRGCFLLAGAALLGWAVGLAVALPPDILALMLGFLSGGVIVNSAIAELPSKKDGRFLPFLVGSLVYACVLIATGS